MLLMFIIVTIIKRLLVSPKIKLFGDHSWMSGKRKRNKLVGCMGNSELYLAYCRTVKHFSMW
ncbi:CLUMA_CG014687, isoform A [Clunio marinus]|uniref:CLUMA_CG014687, isoform A n=1 Tax=Clunio marinus TaxID=568069 RepID=A0A1J1INY4_9DIPT|nr:CLUMA_CG014687, isoform A [Clunio marinus]